MNELQIEELRQRLEMVAVAPADGITVYNVCAAPGYYAAERGNTYAVVTFLLAEWLRRHANAHKWSALWDNVHIAIVTRPRPHLGNEAVVRRLDSEVLATIALIESEARAILHQDDSPRPVRRKKSDPETMRQYRAMMNPNHYTSGSRQAARNRAMRKMEEP